MGWTVPSFLRYAWVTFFFYPLVVAATWVGGIWPIAYLLFAVGMYVLLDNLCSPLVETQSDIQALPNDIYLVLHIPFTLLLLAMYFAKLVMRDDVTGSVFVLGFPLAAFSTAFEALSAGFVIGVHLGTNNVAAHELMHRRGRFWGGCSRVLLVMTGDAQFQEAHLYGHHAAVGTLADPATARRGESFYRFLLRSTLGQWKQAYQYEAIRLRKQRGASKWMHHRVLRGNLATLALLAGVAWLCGPHAVAAYVFIMLIVKAGLEAANYIQHYGLTRDPQAKVEAYHSWDCDTRGSSIYMYNLTRHAEHHAAPRRRFWALQTGTTQYRLPHGYMVAMLLALFPRLWFRYVDGLLCAAVERSSRPC